MEISSVFQTSSEAIGYFFTQGGIGYYIPLYQREYSWDEENIEQLMDDICSGVFELLSSPDTIHFMGTIILVIENDIPNNVKPQDQRAIPSRIDNIIDGQQRISTIALLACCLYKKIHETLEKFPENYELLDELREVAITYLTKLGELFSFDLMRGTPKRKPIVIRGSLDGWTLDGNDSEHYNSDISSYLAQFIRTIDNIGKETESEFPKPRKKSLVARNIKFIEYHLDKIISSHTDLDDNYPPAWDIVDKINQSKLWAYERQELTTIVRDSKKLDDQPLDKSKNWICSLVQLFAFSHYLLERCCFTVIRPTSQLRAFDMFQSLNATGTPLTAIETFKPLVVNIADSESTGFKNSNFDKYFTQVENLMGRLESASSKNKRTNEYLTLFSLTYEGKSLSKQFSTQRKWLIEKFQKDCSSTDNQDSSLREKEEFIHQMGDIATYCQKVIYSSTNLLKCLPEINDVDESEKKLASFCLLYLQEANHRMAHTVLSRFYALAIRSQESSEEEDNESNAKTEFLTACKVVAAFFTLWRSALPNTGLDNIYRDLLQKDMSWKKGTSNVNTEILKAHFQKALQGKGIDTKEKWQSKAINYLRYDNVKKISKFVLFVTSNNTIVDPKEPGLMKIGLPDSSPPYLEPSKWSSEDFKSIEHIAPQKPDLQSGSDWDIELYNNDDYEQIGNLTLLPTPINISASNKRWLNKWIYYRHLAETDPDKLEALKKEAEDNGIELKETTIQLLKNTSHKHHILPIVTLGADGTWDKAFVEKRTQRICDILWEQMNKWLT
jgi:hypothetical protein